MSVIESAGTLVHVKKSVFTPSRLSMVDHPPQRLGLFLREDVGFWLTSSDSGVQMPFVVEGL